MCKKFNIKNIDFLACNSLEYSNWKIYYELLQHYLPTIIGASNNLSGNIKYGGDWVMENTNEDIQNIYFNENITNYSSTLFSSSISHTQLDFYGRSVFLFVLKTNNTFSSLVLNNFTNITFQIQATPLQQIYKVYYREQNVGQFLLASDVNNLNISLLPNKNYQIILVFTNIDNAGNAYYTYGGQTIPVTSILASSNELTMYPSNTSWGPISTFDPNNATTYNSLVAGQVRNQSLTLNYTYKLTPTITNFILPGANINFTNPFIIIDPSSNSNGAFTYVSSDTSIADISGNVLTALKWGIVTITATQEETSDYTLGTISGIFNINMLNFPICFPAGTPVETDQGTIAIEKINPNKNTIRGKKIVAITKTITIEDKIICIEKDAFGTNIPSQKTLISRNHKVFYNKEMIKAKHLVGKVDRVYNKKYNGEILYNVLLETHDKMIINNLIVETLDPNNFVAKLYNSNYTNEERNNIIVNINQCANEYKKFYGKLR